MYLVLVLPAQKWFKKKLFFTIHIATRIFLSNDSNGSKERLNLISVSILYSKITLTIYYRYHCARHSIFVQFIHIQSHTTPHEQSARYIFACKRCFRIILLFLMAIVVVYCMRKLHYNSYGIHVEVNSGDISRHSYVRGNCMSVLWYRFMLFDDFGIKYNNFYRVVVKF